jgi:hypothetical protein
MKSLNNRLANLENTTGQYERLKHKFFFNLPIIESPEGEIQNPVNEDDRAEFEQFLKMAERRNDNFSPIDHE